MEDRRAVLVTRSSGGAMWRPGMLPSRCPTPHQLINDNADASAAAAAGGGGDGIRRYDATYEQSVDGRQTPLPSARISYTLLAPDNVKHAWGRRHVVITVCPFVRLSVNNVAPNSNGFRRNCVAVFSSWHMEDTSKFLWVMLLRDTD